MLLCGRAWTLSFLNNWVVGRGPDVCVFSSGSYISAGGKKDLLIHLMSICVTPSLVQVPCSLTSFKSCTALHFSSALGDNSLSYIWKVFPSKNISSGTSLSL